MFRAAIGVIGFFLLAGSSDLDPFMPLWQVTVQSLIGLAMFTWGVSKYWGEPCQ